VGWGLVLACSAGATVASVVLPWLAVRLRTAATAG
jgi:hypothetical protein